SAKERGGNPSTSTKTNMPKSKKLQKQIENKLEKLSQLLDYQEEARIINSNDPDT
ncbi:6801_t:CDS:1, partial [Funneliformis geosporum]